MGMSVWRTHEIKNAETYGSARWAIHNFSKRLVTLGFNEGSNAMPGHYVIERAFVD
jgi:hypothetical protein